MRCRPSRWATHSRYGRERAVNASGSELRAGLDGTLTLPSLVPTTVWLDLLATGEEKSYDSITPIRGRKISHNPRESLMSSGADPNFPFRRIRRRSPQSAVGRTPNGRPGLSQTSPGNKGSVIKRANLRRPNPIPGQSAVRNTSLLHRAWELRLGVRGTFSSSGRLTA